MIWYLLLLVPALAGQLNVTEKLSILNVFNQARCDLNAPPPIVLPAMYWDTSLEAMAQSYVDGCPGGPPVLSSYGNFYSGFAQFGDNSASQLAGFQTAYKEYWTYGTYQGTDQCSATSCATYTQIINAGTSRVGCALNTNMCTGVCGPPMKCCGNTTTCHAQFVCFFDPKGNVIGQVPYEKGVLSEVNPPQACQFKNATSLNILATGACALSLPKQLNSTCGSKVDASQTCVVTCAKGFVPRNQSANTTSVSCGLGVLSPSVTAINLCKQFVSGASSVSVHVLALIVLVSCL